MQREISGPSLVPRPVAGPVRICNTHTHTNAKPGSDANGTPDYVAEWYRSHGYQCLVITDHEFHTDVAPLNGKYGQEGNFLVLQGQERNLTAIVAAGGTVIDSDGRRAWTQPVFRDGRKISVWPGGQR